MAGAAAPCRSVRQGRQAAALRRAAARFLLTTTSDMRVLITGGAGFIGSALARHFVLERGCAVLVIDKLTYAGDRRNLAACEGRPGFSFLEADITDAAAMARAMEGFAPDAIAHLAAESHVD